MNSIEQLKLNIERSLAGIETSLRKPRKENGHWWLTVKFKERVVRVEWVPTRGFGISTLEPDTAYGEGPDELFGDPAGASRRVVELLRSGQRSIPPNEVLLRDLRATVGCTQEELADRLGVQQAAVSRLERRSDITLGSLRRYVEALGAELEISVKTKAGEQIKLWNHTTKKERR
ncbi:MAG TPA: helix-turn-helix domain-containing protein [Kofleriaceae bacterium]|jgi:plasmid maintenance system antidote protein VapI